MKIRSLFVLTIIAALLGMATACDDFLKDPNSTGTDNDLPGENPNLPSNSQNYTVSFAANGGSPAPQNQTVSHGGKATEPAAITKAGYDFGGWYKEVTLNNQWNFNSDTVTGNIVLYAKWGYTTPPITVQGNTLAEKLQWLIFNAENNGNYVFELTAIYEPLPPQTLFYAGRSNISIQLKGIGSSDRVIELASNDSYVSLFTIGNGVTLILDSDIALFGKYDSSNGRSLITVNPGGSLILNQGAKISGNTGSGVSVGGTFTMNGGEISGNSGGVSVGEYYYGYTSRTFIMNGGKISGNTGSGVYVQSGTFTMTGGEISGNTADRGGGVCVQSGTFTMTGGVILGNTAGMGGGVYVTGGYYSRYDYDYRYSTISFEKTGGTITGYSSDTVNGNVSSSLLTWWDDNITHEFIPGHAVYVGFDSTDGFLSDGSLHRYKNTTAAQGDNLIYISNGQNPPTISGVWDE